MVTHYLLVVTMALTDIQIKNAKLEPKQYKLSAGLGLYLIISPMWRVVKNDGEIISIYPSHLL